MTPPGVEPEPREPSLPIPSFHEKYCSLLVSLVIPHNSLRPSHYTFSTAMSWLSSFFTPMHCDAGSEVAHPHENAPEHKEDKPEEESQEVATTDEKEEAEEEPAAEEEEEEEEEPEDVSYASLWIGYGTDRNATLEGLAGSARGMPVEQPMRTGVQALPTLRGEGQCWAWIQRRGLRRGAVSSCRTVVERAELS